MYNGIGYTNEAPAMCGERQPAVVAALQDLSREITDAEGLLGALLSRLDVVTAMNGAEKSCEPVPAYSAPLAQTIAEQAERVAAMRRRLTAQLNSLELP